MPIKDLSETVRLPRLGKIRLGIKVKKIRQSDGKEIEYPEKTDYFVFPEGCADRDKLVGIFGEKPKQLRIMIPVEDEEKWAEQYYRAYHLTRGLVCKGDGEVAMRQIDVKTGDLPGRDTQTVAMKEMPCAGRECPDYKAKKCHETLNLRFLIPEVPGLGVWEIDTKSINAILNINSAAQIIRRAFGRVSMIPLILSVEPAKAKNPEDGKQQTIYVLNLRTDVTLAQLADVAREQAKTLMLTAPDLEAAYEVETEQLTDDLFGEAPPPRPTAPPEAPAASASPAPAPAVVEGTPISAPPVTGLPIHAYANGATTQGELIQPDSSGLSAKDKLIANVRERKPSLKTNKNVIDFLTAGPNGISKERIDAYPDGVWAEVQGKL